MLRGSEPIPLLFSAPGSCPRLRREGVAAQGFTLRNWKFLGVKHFSCLICLSTRHGLAERWPARGAGLAGDRLCADGGCCW